MRYKYFEGSIVLAAFIFCQSCSNNNKELIVPESAVIAGYLYSGNPVDSIRITQTNSYTGDGIFRTIDDLGVILNDGETDYFLDYIGDGYYEAGDLIIKSGRSYHISFEWQGKEISATTYIPQPKAAEISDTIVYREQIGSSGGFRPGVFEQQDAIEITWDNTDGNYYFVLVENTEDSADYIFTFLQELIEQGDTIRRPSFRSRPEIIDFYSVDTFRDLQQFGLHRVVVYRLNPEYAALYEQVGNSSINITAPPTNVENGLGIFTGISTDTLYFEVRKE
jgi:hypothetical protein